MYCDFVSVHKYGSGYDYILRFLLKFSYAPRILKYIGACIQDLIMRPVKRLLDMHPSMSTLR